MLENGIPGQTGCLYGDDRPGGGVLSFLDADYIWEMDME